MTISRRLLGLLLFLIGVGYAGLYALDNPLPVRAAVIVFMITTVWMLLVLPQGTVSLLPRFMLLLYVLPFTSLIGYVVVREFIWWEADNITTLVLENALIVDMLAVAMVGLLGLGAGIALAVRRTGNGPARESVIRADRTLSVPRFVGLTSIGFGLAVLSVLGQVRPEGGGYFSDALEAARSGGRFGTLYIVAYVLLATLFVDGLSERVDAARRRFKLTMVIGVTAVILVFFQLLRGEREIAGLLVALGALFITDRVWEDDGLRRERSRLRRLVPVCAILFVAFLAVGQLRSSSGTPRAGSGVIGAAVTELSVGATWTAVLLGNLGLAAEHQSKNFEYLRGDTYADYLVSLPPSFVTRALGLQRAIEGETGPGLWYYPVQFGGVHPVLVPFKNFGVAGVLLILCLTGWIIARQEAWGRSGSQIGRIFYGAFFVSSFNWFWYGDMPMIRALMATLLVTALHQLLVGFRITAALGKQPRVLASATPETAH